MDSYPQISAKEVSRRIKAAGVDEMIVFLRMTGGHHAAALMLDYLVRNVGSEWVHVSMATWEQTRSLSRARLATATNILKRCAGLEIIRRGSVTLYKLDNAARFWDALDAAIAEVRDGSQ